MKLFRTNRRFARFTAGTAAILAVMTLGWALAAHTNLLNPVFGRDTAYANPPADDCIHLVDGIHVNAQNANADIRLVSPCGVRQFQMKTWYAPSASGVPHDQQVLAYTSDIVTARVRDNAPTHINVKMIDPGCFYQVDVIDVTSPPNGGYPIVASDTGGNHDCTPPDFACTGLTATPGSKDQTSGNQAFTLTASATVKHGTIVKYDFNFGDGTSASAPSHATSASVMHTYAPGNYSASAVVTVKDAGGNLHTSPVGNCQAPITVTPPQPPEKKLTCDSLSATPGSVDPDTGNQSYGFTAHATAQNVTILDYRFHFGDGSDDATVTTASTSHTYAPGNYDAQVFVNASDGHSNVTSEACKVHLSVAPLPRLSCDSLTATPGTIDPANGNQAYGFVARATAQNTIITSYVFEFGDGQNQTVTTSDTTANADHTYAPGDYTARVTVKTATDSKTSDACKATIHVAPPQESSLVCASLSATPGEIAEDGSQGFHFNATATKNNATITNYVFSFGDGSADATVTTDALSASTDHTYTPGTYAATAKVNGTDHAGRPISSPPTDNCKYTVTVKPPLPKNPSIKLTKVVDGVKYKMVAVGQHFVYQLVITNTGEKDLKDAKVTDPAPAGVTLLSADLGDIANNSFSYTIPSLAVGQSVTVNITAVVTTYIAGNLVNTACVDTPDVPGQPDSCDSATVTVPPPTKPPVTPPKVIGATTLVNTGPGSIAALATAVAVGSAIAYRFILGRKLSN